MNRGNMVPVLCVHGDIVKYPTAEVDLHFDGVRRRVKVVVAPSLPVPVLLGRELYDVQKE